MANCLVVGNSVSFEIRVLDDAPNSGEMLSRRDDPGLAMPRNNGGRVPATRLRIGAEPTMVLGDRLVLDAKFRIDDVSDGGEDHVDAEVGELAGTSHHHRLSFGRGHPGQSFLARQSVDSRNPDVLNLAALMVARDDGLDAVRADTVDGVKHGLELRPLGPMTQDEDAGKALGVNEVGDVLRRI